MRDLDVLFPHEPNRARYLPAVSHNYAVVAAQTSWQCLGLTGSDLDYLHPGNSAADIPYIDKHFHYPCTLTSAGQAALTDAKGRQATIVSQRDRNSTFVIADSGGFQVQQGTLPWEGEATVRRMLKWMENTADWVMALDFPTGGISMGTVTPHIKRLLREAQPINQMNAVNSLGLGFNACMQQTRLNTELMLKERDAQKAGFLVVLQGRNESESATWYKEFQPFIEDGIAFAGAHARNYALLLSRLLDMRADGTLRRLKHIHILGTSTIGSAVLFTCIQRLIRQHDNQYVQITYDTASPFLLAGRAYEIYTSYGLDYVNSGMANDAPSKVDPSHYGLTLNDWCERLTEERNKACEAIGQEMQSPVRTHVGSRVRVGELLKQGELPPQPDARAFMLACNHNVQAVAEAHSHAIDIYFDGFDGKFRFPRSVQAVDYIASYVFENNANLSRQIIKEAGFRLERPI